MELAFGIIIGVLICLTFGAYEVFPRVRFARKIIPGTTLSRTQFVSRSLHTEEDIKNIDSPQHWFITIISRLPERPDGVIGEFPDGTRWFFTIDELYFGEWTIIEK